MKRINFLGALFISLLAFLCAPVSNTHAASIIYAIPSGLTTGDCDTWANGCTLQYAISQAVSGDEIWVAAGTYIPTTDGNLKTAFSLKIGVAIYGGFDGTETSLDKRDPETHLTILSGDLGDDDTNTNGVVTDYTDIVGDNSYWVVKIPNNVTSATRLDGFTITAGHNVDDINKSGSGISMYTGNPTLSNLHISGNYADLWGGGLNNSGGSPTITNVVFLGNGASTSGASNGGGGGIYTSGGSPVLTNVDFIRNYGKAAGGILKYSGSLTLTNVGFYGNKSSEGGAAMYFMEVGTDTMVNVAFVGQTGATALRLYFADPILTNATFAMNADGELSCTSYANPSLVNSIFSNSITTCSGYTSDHTSIGVDPGFLRDPSSGTDVTWGTEDDDYGDLNLIPTSSAVDAGNNNAAGLTGITTDLAGENRFIDVTTTSDTGSGNAPIVDQGAYEADGIAADLIADISNDTFGEVTYGDSFNWTVTVTNTGAITASFATSQTILTNNLPSSGAIYGAPVVQNSTGITGTFSCAIDSNLLSCSADGAVVMGDEGSTFDVTVPVTPTISGTISNPGSGGSCSVDPNGVIVETIENNNDCNSDSVTVLAPDLIASLANNVSGEVTFGKTFTWTLTITNTDTVSASFTSGQIILLDDLPSSGAIYGAPVVQNSSGITGAIDCSIVNHNLTCVADSAVSLAASGGKFEVAIPVTSTVVGLLSNPRSGGSCTVDPNGAIVETNETNNACISDAVTSNPISVFLPVVSR